MSPSQTPENADDVALRTYIYNSLVREGKAPTAARMAANLRLPLVKVRRGLKRLAATHAFVLQQNGELWRAAPFSAVPTAFPVRIGRRSWYGNCIWDALGIPAMLGQNAVIDSTCACCNLEMPLHVRNGKLAEKQGIIHFAVPARHWYKDIVFT